MKNLIILAALAVGTQFVLATESHAFARSPSVTVVVSKVTDIFRQLPSPPAAVVPGQTRDYVEVRAKTIVVTGDIFYDVNVNETQLVYVGNLRTGGNEWEGGVHSLEEVLACVNQGGVAVLVGNADYVRRPFPYFPGSGPSLNVEFIDPPEIRCSKSGEWGP